MKRCLVLGRMAMGKLIREWKDRNVLQKTRILIILKTLVFQAVTYGCETWTIKEAGKKIAFEI